MITKLSDSLKKDDSAFCVQSSWVTLMMLLRLRDAPSLGGQFCDGHDGLKGEGALSSDQSSLQAL